MTEDTIPFKCRIVDVDNLRWTLTRNSQAKMDRGAGSSQMNEKELKSLHIIFGSLDEDGSGSIDMDELKSALGFVKKKIMHSGIKSISSSELDDLFESMDEDGNGEVDFFEFKTALVSAMLGGKSDSSSLSLKYLKEYAMDHQRLVKLEQLSSGDIKAMDGFQHFKTIFKTHSALHEFETNTNSSDVVVEESKDYSFEKVVPSKHMLFVGLKMEKSTKRAVKNIDNVLDSPSTAPLGTLSRSTSRLFLKKSAPQFTFTLPVNMDQIWQLLYSTGVISRPKKDDSQRQTAYDEDPRLQVLVIDESYSFLKSIQKILSEGGHLIHVARNGIHAMELINDNDYDIAFMSDELPIMESAESISFVREKDIPLIRKTLKAGEVSTLVQSSPAERILKYGMSTPPTYISPHQTTLQKLERKRMARREASHVLYPRISVNVGSEKIAMPSIQLTGNHGSSEEWKERVQFLRSYSKNALTERLALSRPSTSMSTSQTRVETKKRREATNSTIIHATNQEPLDHPRPLARSGTALSTILSSEYSYSSFLAENYPFLRTNPSIPFGNRSNELISKGIPTGRTTKSPINDDICDEEPYLSAESYLAPFGDVLLSRSTPLDLTVVGKPCRSPSSPNAIHQDGSPRQIFTAPSASDDHYAMAMTDTSNPIPHPSTAPTSQHLYLDSHGHGAAFDSNDDSNWSQNDLSLASSSCPDEEIMRHQDTPLSPSTSCPVNRNFSISPLSAFSSMRSMSSQDSWENQPKSSCVESSSSSSNNNKNDGGSHHGNSPHLDISHISASSGSLPIPLPLPFSTTEPVLAIRNLSTSNTSKSLSIRDDFSSREKILSKSLDIPSSRSSNEDDIKTLLSSPFGWMKQKKHIQPQVSYCKSPGKTNNNDQDGSKSTLSSSLSSLSSLSSSSIVHGFVHPSAISTNATTSSSAISMNKASSNSSNSSVGSLHDVSLGSPGYGSSKVRKSMEKSEENLQDETIERRITRRGRTNQKDMEDMPELRRPISSSSSSSSYPAPPSRLISSNSGISQVSTTPSENNDQLSRQRSEGSNTSNSSHGGSQTIHVTLPLLSPITTKRKEKKS